MTMKDLQSAAMKLPAGRRAQLAATLLSSLDSAEPAEIQDAWIREAGRRYQAYKRGKVQAIPAADAIRKVRGSLRSNVELNPFPPRRRLAEPIV